MTIKIYFKNLPEGNESRPCVDAICRQGPDMDKVKRFLQPAVHPRHRNIVIKALLHLRQAPDLRQDKVQPLSKAIRTSTYRIDYRKLADCLISSMLLGLLK